MRSVLQLDYWVIAAFAPLLQRDELLETLEQTKDRGETAPSHYFPKSKSITNTPWDCHIGLRWGGLRGQFLRGQLIGIYSRVWVSQILLKTTNHLTPGSPKHISYQKQEKRTGPLWSQTTALWSAQGSELLSARRSHCDSR